MKRYVAVMHCWFVVSKGFKVRQITADTQEDARTESIVWQHEQSSDFKDTAVLLLEIGTHETVRPGTRLTLWERITGFVRFERTP